MINDSSVICAYLERRFPKPALYPSDDYEYARALWLEEFIDGGLVPVAGPKIFLPLVLKPLFGGKPSPTRPTRPPRRRRRARSCPLFWDYLEKQLGDNEFSWAAASRSPTSPWRARS